MKSFRGFALGVIAGAALMGGSAHASLTGFQTYVGNYGVSTDGWGSTSQVGVISADVPAGATVVAAYLYTSTFGSFTGAGGTLAGSAVSYASLGTNTSSSVLTAGRADVTSIIKPLVDGGIGGVYNFNVTETSSNQDGEALVVVYQLASLTNSTVGILDGFATVTGDNTAINFATGLTPSAPGFFAEMRLGIGFSFNGAGCTSNGQTSQVKVNGTVVTNNAGCNDDNADVSPGNGNLITVGGFDDPFSPALPTPAADHERYNLVSYIADGSTTISVDTVNASRDDNIFLAVFHVAGEAGINAPPPTTGPTPVPEPQSLALLLLALTGIGAQRKWFGRR